MSVFDTPRKPNNVDSRLLEMSRIQMNRRNNIRTLLEASENELDMKQNKEMLDKMDIDHEKDRERNQKLTDMKDKTSKSLAKNAMIGLESRLYHTGSTKLFSNTIFEMAYNACWIDDVVKENNVSAMHETFKNVIETLESVGINVDMKNDPTHFIQNMRVAINEACAKATKRISEDVCIDYSSADDIDSIDFSLTDEEADDLANSLNDLGKEDIEQLVKSKVLAVVQDEKEKTEELNNDLQELNDAAEETGDDDSEIESSDEDTSDNESSANEAFNMLVNRNKNMKAYRKVGTSLFECLMMYHTYNNQNIASTLESGRVLSMKDIMGVALQESVLVYTIMETFNTLGLCKFNHRNVEKLCSFYRSKLR